MQNIVLMSNQMIVLSREGSGVLDRLVRKLPRFVAVHTLRGHLYDTAVYVKRFEQGLIGSSISLTHSHTPHASTAQIEIHFSQATGPSDAAENGGGCGGGALGTAQAARGATGGGHFVVEVCTSQEDDRWKEVSACYYVNNPLRHGIITVRVYFFIGRGWVLFFTGRILELW